MNVNIHFYQMYHLTENSFLNEILVGLDLRLPRSCCPAVDDGGFVLDFLRTQVDFVEKCNKQWESLDEQI